MVDFMNIQKCFINYYCCEGKTEEFSEGSVSWAYDNLLRDKIKLNMVFDGFIVYVLRNLEDKLVGRLVAEYI